MKTTQEVVDCLTRDLHKSRSMCCDLINQNKILLNELKAQAGVDDATRDTYELMKQEMIFLKTCLFLSMVFVMCGGRADFLALIVLVWTCVDVLA